MNEQQELKVLKLKSEIYDIIRKQELHQLEINKLQQLKLQTGQTLDEAEKELAAKTKPKGKEKEEVVT